MFQILKPAVLRLGHALSGAHVIQILLCRLVLVVTPIRVPSARRFSRCGLIGQDDFMISTDDEHELDPQSGPARARYERDTESPQ